MTFLVGIEGFSIMMSYSSVWLGTGRGLFVFNFRLVGYFSDYHSSATSNFRHVICSAQNINKGAMEWLGGLLILSVRLSEQREKLVFKKVH